MSEQCDVRIKRDAKEKYILRFHAQDQREQLKRRAAQNHRTLNAEILALIEAGMRAMDREGLGA